MWDSAHATAVILAEAADLCRQCRRMAPFCFHHGNTFAAIIRHVVEVLSVELEQDAQLKFIVRSLAGNIVPEVATEEEVNAFCEFSDSLA